MASRLVVASSRLDDAQHTVRAGSLGARLCRVVGGPAQRGWGGSSGCCPDSPLRDEPRPPCQHAVVHPCPGRHPESEAESRHVDQTSGDGRGRRRRVGVRQRRAGGRGGTGGHAWPGVPPGVGPGRRAGRASGRDAALGARLLPACGRLPVRDLHRATGQDAAARGDRRRRGARRGRGEAAGPHGPHGARAPGHPHDDHDRCRVRRVGPGRPRARRRRDGRARPGRHGGPEWHPPRLAEPVRRALHARRRAHRRHARRGLAASSNTRPSVRRRPDRTTLTPWRSGAADHPLALAPAGRGW